MKKILYFALVLLGAFFVVYGGYDDSPGGQMLGLLLVVFGIFRLVRGKKNA